MTDFVQMIDIVRDAHDSDGAVRFTIPLTEEEWSTLPESFTKELLTALPGSDYMLAGYLFGEGDLLLPIALRTVDHLSTLPYWKTIGYFMRVKLLKKEEE